MSQTCIPMLFPAFLAIGLVSEERISEAKRDHEEVCHYSPEDNGNGRFSPYQLTKFPKTFTARPTKPFRGERFEFEHEEDMDYMGLLFVRRVAVGLNVCIADYYARVFDRQTLCPPMRTAHVAQLISLEVSFVDPSRLVSGTRELPDCVAVKPFGAVLYGMAAHLFSNKL